MVLGEVVSDAQSKSFGERHNEQTSYLANKTSNNVTKFGDILHRMVGCFHFEVAVAHSWHVFFGRDCQRRGRGLF